jgi:SAM-dependent methyltransferase
MPPVLEYKPNQYWNRLIAEQFDLRGVGYPYLSKAFNQWLYRGMRRAVDRAIGMAGLDAHAIADARILDIGSGTGFWIEYWRAMGARRIDGVDLTDASVEHLARRYPEHSFRQRDIADPLQPEEHGAYDLISAMSILHHIASQARWEAALGNVASMLAPGGHLLLMDPMLRHAWWGPPFGASSHGRPRHTAEHVAILKRHGVEVIGIVPTVSLLANPVDARTRVSFRLQDLLWHKVLTPLARSESAMRLVGAPWYALDRGLCSVGFMPNSKTLVCRRNEQPHSE